VTPPPETRPAVGSPHPDFDGDGFADLAVGVPAEDVGMAENAGGVNVLYGSAAGIDGAGAQFWSQDSPGVLDAAQPDDLFGQVLAAGDFDGDGFDDLAVGVPFEDLLGADEGAVAVLYGSAGGLQAASRDDQVWSQNTAGIADQPEDGDQFGWALAAGDFDTDGFADLAIGVPSEGLSHGRGYAGAVEVIYGSANGLTASGDRKFTQDTEGVMGLAEALDEFGKALAAGDLNDDGYADLAIGAPYEDVVDENGDEGAVNVLFGFAQGLQADAPDDQLWTQNSSGVKGGSENSDHFGAVLISGDFGNGSADDLAIGVPDEALGLPQEGAVNVLYGTPSGLDADDPDDQLWTQDSAGIADAPDNGDVFGSALAAGDMGHGSFDDLAIGVPGEAFGPGANESKGVAHVLYGSASGLSSAGSQLWSQDAPGVGDQSEYQDRFGFALAVADFGGTSEADLASGVPGETVDGPPVSIGAVQILYGSSAGIGTVGQGFFTQDTPGVPDTAEEHDFFGSALAPGCNVA
jgi:hypothetical protein